MTQIALQAALAAPRVRPPAIPAHGGRREADLAGHPGARRARAPSRCWPSWIRRWQSSARGGRLAGVMLAILRVPALVSTPVAASGELMGGGRRRRGAGLWPVAAGVGRARARASARRRGGRRRCRMPSLRSSSSRACRGGALAAAGLVRLMRKSAPASLPAALYAGAAVRRPPRAAGRGLVADLGFRPQHPVRPRRRDGRARLQPGRPADAAPARARGQRPPRLARLRGFRRRRARRAGAGPDHGAGQRSLTVALALAALGAAWVTTRQPLGLLRYASRRARRRRARPADLGPHARVAETSARRRSSTGCSGAMAFRRSPSARPR